VTLVTPDSPTTAATAPAAPESPRPRLLALVDRIAAVLDNRTSRRGFLSRVAVVGSAVAVGPVTYALRPGTAYANVCGTDSTCSSGYTVFCATINNGVNRCPPNSLVGGWWKADGSGFCCGNARYYIDCHSYCSCGCGGGSRFCGEGCRSCSCGCGPSGQCDQRRVCCNNFRYGQCMQHVSCSGPVWCRVVTCTPPWRVPQWQCTTTSATDNRTGAHTSPALAGCTPIVQKYTALGGPGSKLGEARTGELVTQDGVGRFTDYDGGGMIWHPDHGAHPFYYAIRDKYYALQGERGKLGYARSGENPAADGQGYFNHFVGGDIWYHPRHGTHVIFYAIRDKFYAGGWERSKLGYPTSDEIQCADGVGYYNSFVGGDVYWHPQHGTRAMYYAIRDKYTSLDRERGPLGYPVSSERVSVRGGTYNDFAGRNGEGGSLYWSPATGTWSVRGPIRDEWLRRGGAGGRLGYPVSDPYLRNGRTRSDFENGSITYDPSTGRFTVVEG
jgi:hypothetical protein